MESRNIFNLQNFEQKEIPFKQRSFEDSIDTLLRLFDADLLLIWINNFRHGFRFRSASCPVLHIVLIISRRECISENAKSFKEAGSKKPSNFFDNENSPLFQAAGPVINHTSVAPLHVSLGLGLKNLNAAEEIAVEEDKKIEAANGLSSEKMTELLNQRGNLCDELDSSEQKHDEFFANLQSLENSSEMLRSKMSLHSEKRIINLVRNQKKL